MRGLHSRTPHFILPISGVHWGFLLVGTLFFPFLHLFPFLLVKVREILNHTSVTFVFLLMRFFFFFCSMRIPIQPWYLEPVLTGGAFSIVLVGENIPWILNLLFISFSLWHHGYKKRKCLGMKALKISIDLKKVGRHLLERAAKYCFLHPLTSHTVFQLLGCSFQFVTSSQNYFEKEEVFMFKKNMPYFPIVPTESMWLTPRHSECSNELTRD